MIAFDRQLFVFGGAADNILSSDLHCFDLDSQTWSLAPKTPDSQVPTGRLFHSAAVVGDAMYVFGGTIDNNIRSGEMYRFQLAAFPKCTLQDDYGKLLHSQLFCDVDFVLGSRPGGEDVGDGKVVVSAHQAIVAARSQWLRRKLLSTLGSEPNDRKMSLDERLTVNLAEVTADSSELAFRLVLDFIYTDKIDPTEDRRDQAASNHVVLTMMEVYTLAVTFQMDKLSHLCAAYIEASIDLSNVLVALKNASRLDLQFIKEFCLKFIIKDSNYNQIVMSQEFESIEQPLMVEIIRRKQCPASQQLPVPPYRGGATSPGQLDHPPPAEYPSKGSSLKEDMKGFLNSHDGKLFSDVTLMLDSFEIPSHRAILAARSSYFEGLFRSFNPSDRRIQITIGDMVPSRQSFSSMLRYVYYGDVTMPPEDSLYLFAAPSYYIFSNSRLQVYCKANLERNVTVDNVVQILEAADRSQAQDMKRYALSMIVRHFAKVARLPRIRSLSKELLLDIVQALAEEMGGQDFAVHGTD